MPTVATALRTTDFRAETTVASMRASLPATKRREGESSWALPDEPDDVLEPGAVANRAGAAVGRSARVHRGRVAPPAAQRDRPSEDRLEERRRKRLLHAP